MSIFSIFGNPLTSSDTFLPASFQTALRIITPLYGLFIIWASLQKSVNTGLKIPHLDKILHAGVYGLLAMLLCLGWPKISKVKIWVSVLSIGGIMELAQGTLTSGRTPSFWDFTANGVGALLGIIFVIILNQKSAPKRSVSNSG